MTHENPRHAAEILKEAKAVEAAIRRAVRKALIQHKQAGNPIAVWENGRVVWIPPEEIDVGEETAEEPREGPVP